MAIARERRSAKQRHQQLKQRHKVAAAGEREIAFRMNKMLDQVEAGTGYGLPDEQIQVNRSDMFRRCLVHRADFTCQKVSDAGCNIFDIWRGENRDTIWIEKARDAAQERERALQVFDYLDRND